MGDETVLCCSQQTVCCSHDRAKAAGVYAMHKHVPLLLLLLLLLLLQLLLLLLLLLLVTKPEVT
jgi:hypothetical protein